MKKIMSYSSKGGSGKSTSLLVIGQTFSKKGYRVCILDCDPQANLSKTLLKGRVFEEDYVSMAELFQTKVDADLVHKAINHVSENLDMIGSRMELVDSERLVSSDIMCDRGRVLEKITNCIKDEYDLILMDFNPYPSLLTTNGFLTSDFVIIPTTCDEWGGDGVVYTLQQVYQVQEEFGKEIQYKVLINMKARNNDDKNFQESIESELAEHEMFKTAIHYQAKPFKDKDVCVTDFKKGDTTVGKEWEAVLEEFEREVINNG